MLSERDGSSSKTRHAAVTYKEFMIAILAESYRPLPLRATRANLVRADEVCHFEGLVVVLKGNSRPADVLEIPQDARASLWQPRAETPPAS
ncbi:hypothetical protein CSOJ01_06556 [Colletotrichum sojae]|uniref:Uncharacterized protein n=1 Tax=Colletotrichum sojae TaxID=2175907 RepID=A0A8H6MVQ1_9PEZI|nr:hypothetical protein CSOJ01_06556 [Colletotrichum sojae]